jgi:prepilin-type N-terminal cleavage/methylation domain-containing protein
MTHVSSSSKRGEQGVSLIELLVAVVIFALLFFMIDSTFSSARRSARKAELGAEVNQNARIVVERLTREIREADSTPGMIKTIPGVGVAFKSARTCTRELPAPDCDYPAEENIFCVDVLLTSEPPFHAACVTTPGPAPSPPLSGSYTPIWQRAILYYLAQDSTCDQVGGGYAVVRDVTDLSTSIDEPPAPPTSPLSAVPSGSPVVAKCVQSFDIDVSPSGIVTVTVLQGRGQEVVQGSIIPAQEIRLQGTTRIRN